MVNGYWEIGTGQRDKYILNNKELQIMAKQCGDRKIIGTIGNITFYKMGDEWYARMKSSLTGKRFWKDKAFEGSRRSSARLAAGSKLASDIYRTLPEVKRCYALYRALKSLAIRLLKDGYSQETVVVVLDQELRKVVKRRTRVRRKRTVQKKSVFVVLPREGVRRAGTLCPEGRFDSTQAVVSSSFARQRTRNRKMTGKRCRPDGAEGGD